MQKKYTVRFQNPVEKYLNIYFYRGYIKSMHLDLKKIKYTLNKDI